MQQVLCALSVVALAGFTPAADKEVEGELKKLEGTWTITSAEARGRKIELKNLGMDEMVVKGGKITFRSNGKDVKTYALTVAPAKDPKEMDWTGEVSDLHKCIYELTGSEIKLAFPVLEGKNKKVTFPRPRTFNTVGKPVMVLVAKRGK
jgi:uncharacterized protein (TIGR03067 family)